MATPPPSNPTDFNATAAAAAARIFSPSSSPDDKSPAEHLAESLTLDSPKIDTAVRAFLSLVAARSITATKTEIEAVGSTSTVRKCFFTKDGGKDPNLESLRCARALLKAINNLTLPDSEKEIEKKDDAAWVEGQVVRIVWNALISKGHKPSKIFGRRALRCAYPVILDRLQQDKDSILPAGVDQDCSLAFFEEFGALLDPRANAGAQAAGSTEEDDHFLLWDADGGAEELQRRRDRRVQRGRDAASAAESRAREALSSTVSPSLVENGETPSAEASSVTIEEIAEEEERKDESSN